MQQSEANHSRNPMVRCALRVARASVLALALVAVLATGAFAQAQGGPGGQLGGFGGSGKLTGRSGSTLELEGFMGTSKVVVTSATKYRQTEDTDATTITKGSCVRVSGDGDTSTAIDATSVSILDSVQMCNAQRTTRGGSFPNGGELPGGAELPNGGSLPTDGSRTQRAFGGGVIGKVKSVDGDTVVVIARVPKQSGSSSGNRQPKLVKRTVTVTVADSTTVTHTVDATDSVLVVGACLTSEGSTDSVGTVSAKEVTASPPDSSGSCTGGFAGGPPSTSGSSSGSI